MNKPAALAAFLFVAGSSTFALADEPPSRGAKKDKKGGCSVDTQVEDDALLGLAGVVLLISGLALRRRSETDAPLA